MGNFENNLFKQVMLFCGRDMKFFLSLKGFALGKGVDEIRFKEQLFVKHLLS